MGFLFLINLNPAESIVRFKDGAMHIEQEKRYKIKYKLQDRDLVKFMRIRAMQRKLQYWLDPSAIDIKKQEEKKISNVHKSSLVRSNHACKNKYI